MASLKCMLGVFAATGRLHYSQELPKHMYHLSTIFPDYVLHFFRSGGFANALSENPASAIFIDETHEMTFNKDMALQAHQDISKYALEILLLYMPFRATMNRNWKKIRDPNDECINMKDFGSTLIQEEEGSVQSIVTNLRGSQIDPDGLPFKLAGRQHVYQIFTGAEASKQIQEGMLKSIKTGEEYMQSYTQKYTNEKNCIKRKSVFWKKVRVFQPYNRKEKSSAKKDQEQINTIRRLKLELTKINIWSKSKAARRAHQTTFDNTSRIRDWSLLIPRTGAEGNIIFSPKYS